MNKEAIDAICQRTLDLVHGDNRRQDVLTRYWTDVLHDILQLGQENAPTEFLWCPCAYGTYLFALPLPDKESDPHNVCEALRYATNAGLGNEHYIWHIYTEEHGLCEIERSRVIDMLEEKTR